MEFEGISLALKQGFRLHAFRSGGGLMVVRISEAEADVLKGYGEHPHIDEALTYANEDYLAGGRKYQDVYGKIYPHYLTGTHESSSALDSWIKCGRTFDAWWKKDEFIAELHGMEFGLDEPFVHFMQTGHGATFNEALARSFSAARVGVKHVHLGHSLPY